jgi:CRISPR-associated endonuclease/helicase Cas3
VRPNTILIVPVGTDEQRKAARELADVPSDSPLDVGDAASCQARDMLVLRLHSELYPTLSAMSESIGAINAESADQFDIDELIDEAIGLVRDTVLQRHNRPERERVGLELDAWSEGNGRVVDVHPLGGVVVHSRRRLHLFDPTDSEERVNSLRGAGVEQCLVDHCDLVGKQADHVAEGLGLPELERRCVELAARFHDVGKADPRFQALLRGNRVIGDLSEPLAKSSHVGRGWSESRRSGWPMGERHEFYSVRMVGDAIEGGERAGLSELTGHEADLVLHLIAAHHGHARPFAPVVIDQASDPSAEFELEMDQQRLEFRPVAGAPRGTGHGLERADSGVAERFWRLTRHYGWWGLAYLEAIVRLADWKASEIAGGDAGNGTARRADVCERQTQEASR